MKIIRIDVDSDAMHRIQRPDLPIVARAEDALPPLLAAVDKHNRARESRADEMLELKANWAKASAYLEPQISYLKVIRDEPWARTASSSTSSPRSDTPRA